ncbi:hypothetical protein [Acidimangrovimonas sediminis]|uniref:hypothetical protein n=1 Tax=Acidimangrovimonas sediminis TaxID=2056283 RepID=UPI0011AFAC33|nr:hypothetical protein [Acidimangrovimonas sediminis]
MEKGFSHLMKVWFRHEPIDIGPYIARAVSECPYKHDFSLSELAELTELAFLDSKISNDMLDRIDGGNLDAITGRVCGWINSAYRIEQICDPGMERMRPYVELLAGPWICPQASAMTGRFLGRDELEVIPLSRCIDYPCNCAYVTRSVGELRRSGRLTSDGDPLPQPHSPPTRFDGHPAR